VVLAIPVIVLSTTFKSLSTTGAQAKEKGNGISTTERDLALYDRMNSHSILFVEYHNMEAFNKGKTKYHDKENTR